MEAKDSLSNLIKKVAEEQKYVDYEADIKKISSGGAGVTADLYLVKLSANEKEDLSLFAKVALMSEKVRNETPMPDPFKIEICFYSEVLENFERLQEKHSIPKEHRIIFPKMYAKSDEYLKETLILENLVAQGFKCHNRLKCITLDYALKAIELIAKFHALSMAFYREDQQKLEELVKKMNFDISGMMQVMDMYRPKMMATALEVATDENRERLEKYFADEDRFVKYLESYRCAKARVLVHGDFKASNLMHRLRNDQLEMIPVDFQMVRNASPVMELLYFLFTATDEEFRRQHYHKLLEHYYEQLSRALQRLHVDPQEAYSEETYRRELEENTMVGLMIGVVVLPIILVSEETVPVFDEEAEAADFMVPASEVYKERFNGLINNYAEWGLL